MNYILERANQVRYFTDMHAVFDAAGMAPETYDWFVSDIQTNWTPPGFSPFDQWFSGAALASFLQTYDVQFMRAVFSAVPTGSRPACSSAPYVNGNPAY